MVAAGRERQEEGGVSREREREEGRAGGSRRESRRGKREEGRAGKRERERGERKSVV